MKVPFYVVAGPVRVIGGAEVDGPGWYLGADGKWHPIPPRGPDAAALIALVGLASLASRVEDTELRSSIEHSMTLATKKLQAAGVVGQ